MSSSIRFAAVRRDGRSAASRTKEKAGGSGSGGFPRSGALGRCGRRDLPPRRLRGWNRDHPNRRGLWLEDHLSEAPKPGVRLLEEAAGRDRPCPSGARTFLSAPPARSELHHLQQVICPQTRLLTASALKLTSTSNSPRYEPQQVWHHLVIAGSSTGAEGLRTSHLHRYPLRSHQVFQNGKLQNKSQ